MRYNMGMPETRTPRQIKESIAEAAQQHHDRIFSNSPQLREEVADNSPLPKHIKPKTVSAFKPYLHVKGRKDVEGRKI